MGDLDQCSCLIETALSLDPDYKYGKLIQSYIHHLVKGFHGLSENDPLLSLHRKRLAIVESSRKISPSPQIQPASLSVPSFSWFGIGKALLEHLTSSDTVNVPIIIHVSEKDPCTSMEPSKTIDEPRPDQVMDDLAIHDEIQNNYRSSRRRERKNLHQRVEGISTLLADDELDVEMIQQLDAYLPSNLSVARYGLDVVAPFITDIQINGPVCEKIEFRNLQRYLICIQRCLFVFLQNKQKKSSSISSAPRLVDHCTGEASWQTYLANKVLHTGSGSFQLEEFLQVINSSNLGCLECCIRFVCRQGSAGPSMDTGLRFITAEMLRQLWIAHRCLDVHSFGSLFRYYTQCYSTASNLHCYLKWAEIIQSVVKEYRDTGKSSTVIVSSLEYLVNVFLACYRTLAKNENNMTLEPWYFWLRANTLDRLTVDYRSALQICLDHLDQEKTFTLALGDSLTREQIRRDLSALDGELELEAVRKLLQEQSYQSVINRLGPLVFPDNFRDHTSQALVDMAEKHRSRPRERQNWYTILLKAFQGNDDFEHAMRMSVRIAHDQFQTLIPFESMTPVLHSSIDELLLNVKVYSDDNVDEVTQIQIVLLDNSRL